MKLTDFIGKDRLVSEPGKDAIVGLCDILDISPEATWVMIKRKALFYPYPSPGEWEGTESPVSLIAAPFIVSIVSTEKLAAIRKQIGEKD